ncbi:glycosyltransferase [Beijerinckia sp. L45]|uniref:glycosyltransferase family 8 protein n=1 Tax=Beijerinckia sp. L45 TaxID=1641855 RepID=UPI00131CCF49|nr:glycosyltransferase [Beijerinckia sp. L45]
MGDVIILCVGPSDSTTDAYRAICDAHGIRFMSVSADVLDGLPISFARFFVHRILERRYKSVLYLDGDTQVCGSLDPLLQVSIPKGRFLAARDPMSIEYQERNTKYEETYLHSIGLPAASARRYFNSGVIRFNLEDWPETSSRVLSVSGDRNHGFRFPDQDPLNIAFGDDYLTMSYKWNFPAFFLNSGFQTLIEPRVYHFMSNPRPWDGPFAPWGRNWFEPYTKLIRQFPQLENLRSGIKPLRYLKYMLQQRYKQLVETPFWGSQPIRKRVLQIEQDAYF